MSETGSRPSRNIGKPQSFAESKGSPSPKAEGNAAEKESESRNKGFCSHFGACGGCAIQDISYENQLALKSKWLKTLFSEFWAGTVPVHPSPQQRYYRNKMEFGFSRQVEKREGEEKVFKSRLGLKMRKRWDKVLDLEDCHLLSPEIPALLESVRKWAGEAGLDYYDLRKHHGFLRHLVVREAKNTGQRMVVLITNEGDFDPGRFLSAVKSAYPATTVCRGINNGLSDVAAVDSVDILYGPGFIEERLNSLSFRISPFSFFQTNTKGAEKLYSIVRGWVRNAGFERLKILFDLYGGSGGFSLYLADLAEKCVCVESVRRAVEDGKRNAALNGISNVEFVLSKTEDYLSKFPGPAPASSRQNSESLVILDPPRCGLHPKALEKLVEIKPPELIYVSCNPDALVRDLKALAQSYKIDAVEGLDLFPHTEHVETLVFLTLR